MSREKDDEGGIAGAIEGFLSCVVKCLLRYRLTTAAVLAIVGASWWALSSAPSSPDPVDLLTLAVAAIGLYLLNLRLEKQDEQMAMQIEQFSAQTAKEVDDKFHSAIGLLSSGDTSARTGALYSLYHVAVKSDKHRNQVAHVLCAHIRERTVKGGYKESYTAKPSNEVQTAINLLFRETVEGDGLYSQFSGKMSPAHLSDAYLVGADFAGAECQRGIFDGTNCQGANFAGSHCQGASFDGSHCQGATFWDARCQGASFMNTFCQGAFFVETLCQGARFTDAQCQGADFYGGQFQGSYAFSERHRAVLSDRINCGAELDTMLVSGPFSDEAIATIEGVDASMPSEWRERMRGIREASKGAPVMYAKEGLPDGIKTGMLEDTPEIRQIIREIEGGD